MQMQLCKFNTVDVVFLSFEHIPQVQIETNADI